MGNWTSLLPSLSNPFARDKSQQEALASDLLDQQSRDVQQGGVVLDQATVLLAKILPCSETLLRRLIWVLIWSWKAAPVALYESLLQDLPCCNKNSNTRSNEDENDDDLSSGCNCQCLNTWWQKTIAIPAAMGFYYFLYDYVSQPVLEAMGCCDSEYLSQGIAIGVLVLHFLSGIAMHLHQKRKEEKAAKMKQSTNSMSNNDGQPSDGDWVALNEKDVPETGVSTAEEPKVEESAPPPGADPVVVPEKKKKAFWPFRKKQEPEFHARSCCGSIV